MFFGEVETQNAEGAILAHSVAAGQLRLKKGLKLTDKDIQNLLTHNVKSVVVARLEADDIHEDEAARRISEALNLTGLIAHEPFTGRVNIFAQGDGVFDLNREALTAFNNINEGVTLATLAPLSRVQSGQMVGTIKIIPYAISKEVLDQALSKAVLITPRFHEFQKRNACLIMTQNEGTKPSLIKKGEAVVRKRLGAIGAEITEVKVVAHKLDEIKSAILTSQNDLILLLTASATSDRRDLAPQALVDAGGEVARFGIPVDPGNLLFVGNIGAKQVIGLPGCVRAPVINGADFVLERIMAGVEISDFDFASMGAGGLLKELPTRPQPRLKPSSETRKIAAVILASGASSRMRGKDKLTEIVDGKPLISKLISEAKSSHADDVFVVLPEEGFDARRAAANGAHVIDNPNSSEGMAAGLRLAVEHLAQNYEAIIFLLGDMPEIDAEPINRLIAAYSPADGREIIRAATKTGKAGHPILFGKRFFEPLLNLKGDIGARGVLAQFHDSVELVRMKNDAPIIDLDTPEEWQDWRAERV